jgi:GNAT superfamily N-acetyltransferase
MILHREQRPSENTPHVTVTNTRTHHVTALAALQRAVFPTLADGELFCEKKYLKHIELFPEGQFVALMDTEEGQIPIASTTTYRTHFDFNHIQHHYIEAIAEGWLTNHDPDGEWLYGVDMSVHPQYRGLKIGRRIYEARRELVRRLNLRGEIAGALIPGYAHHENALTVAQYILRVKQGSIFDPTLSVQLRNGFRIKGILYNHISDPLSGNCATLIVRENPHYQPPAASRPGKAAHTTHHGGQHPHGRVVHGGHGHPVSPTPNRRSSSRQPSAQL